MKSTKKAISLVIAIGLTIIMTLLALFILDYIIPFSRNTKNIEQSVAAYYLADSAVEDALYFLSGAELGEEKHKNIINKKRDYAINMTASGKILPPTGEGNSEFDKNFNILKIGEPIQLEVGYGLITDLSKFEVFIQVPDFDNDSNRGTLSGGNNGIINWQLASKTDMLNASGSLISADDINNTSSIKLENKEGRLTSDDSKKNFDNFYNNYCSGTNSGCILKMSVINKLQLENGNYIPYLEWKITSKDKIPLRYTIIKTKGRSYGFEKNLKIKVPQQTLNEAYDFTVFQ